MAEQVTIVVAVSRLRPGMVTAEVFDARGRLLAGDRYEITSRQDIARFKLNGISQVRVYTTGGSDGDSAPLLGAPLSGANGLSAEFTTELRRARAVHAETVRVIGKLMKAARFGKAFSLEPVREVIGGIVETAVRVPDVALAVSRLKEDGCDEYNHAVNVSLLATALAHACGEGNDRCRSVATGGLLHDIGMLALPERIRRRSGTLTGRDRVLMRRHPMSGVDMLAGREGIREEVLFIVAQHHERYMGGGYPRRLCGDAISPLALMVGLAQEYESMTSVRPWRRRYLPQEALATLFQHSAIHYPRPLVERFTAMLGIYPVGSLVELQSGEKGVVIRRNPHSLLHPVVMVLLDRENRGVEPVVTPLHSDAASSAGRVVRSLRPEHYGIEPSVCLGALASVR